MSRRWIVGILFGALLSISQPAHAAEWLYRSSGAVQNIGKSVVGLPNVRRITNGQRALVSALAQNSVQPDFRYSAQAFPDDPDFALQWNFTAINVSTAWAADTTDPVGGGDSRVVIAVLDTGFANTAPDYAGLHLWTNTGEIAGDGIDNDHDGLVDDIHGWDFVNTDASPADDNGHGTHIVGTIAETTNNTLGAAGIAYNSTIMPLKVLDSAGNGSTSTIAAAISYAVIHGANIINLSLGGTQDDPILHQAIQATVNQGVVVVAAAGNSGASTLDYPAVYSEVIGVSATQFDSTRPSYANYGSGLDLVAPGGNSALDQNHDGYVDGIYQQTCSSAACTSFSTRPFEGTSQATAHVTGVAALLAACGVPTGKISSTMMSTATDLGVVGTDTTYGAGLVNAGAAMQSAGCQAAPTAPTNLVVHPANTIAAVLTSNKLYAYRQPEFSWTGATGDVYQVSWQAAGQTAAVTQQVITKFTPTITTDGTYTFSVSTIDSLDQVSTPITFVYVFRRTAVAVASQNQLRLYDDLFKKIRQLTLAGTQSGVVGGRTESNAADRLVISVAGRPSSALIITTRGLVTRRLQPFGQKFTGSIASTVVESATAKSTIAVATASNGAEVRTYDSSGHSLARRLVYQTYRGGLRLAAGAFSGDGPQEILVAQSAGPEIRVYSPTLQRLAVMSPAGRKYSGGWTVTAADMNGDGHQEIIAVGRGTAGRRPVFALTLHGVVMAKWTLSTAPYDGPIDVVGSDLVGDGKPRLFVTGQNASFLQQWSVLGKKEKQYAISGLHGLRLAVLP